MSGPQPGGAARHARAWWHRFLSNPNPLVKQAPTTVAAALAGTIVLTVPELRPTHAPSALIGLGGIFAATAYAALLSLRQSLGHLTVLVIPMVDIMGFGMLRAGTGGTASLFTSLILLPVVWLASARGIRYVVVVGALTSAALLLPYVDDPPERTVELLRGVISPLVFATVAAIINETSRQLRLRADQAEELVRQRDRTLTENARLIRTLQQSERRYRDLLESMESLWASTTAQAIIATDLHGTVDAWNPGAEKLFGRTEEETVRALRIDMLFPPTVLDALVDEQTNVTDGINPAEARLVPLFANADDEAPLEGDLQVIAAGDVLLPARVTVTHRQGGVPGYLFVVSDESRAAEMSRLKDELVAIISHELRAPVSSILGFLDLLRNNSVEPLTEDQLELIAVIERNARRLLALVGDLLFTARAESEGIELSRSEGDVRELVKMAVISAGPAAASKGIDLVGEYPPQPALASVDDQRFGQALDNLISNAIKFTPNAGHVTARVEHLSDSVLVSVEDTGVGIPEAEQRSLFTRFFRASTATMNGIPGVGLGLVITRSIVRTHGGTMSLRSTVGEGTEITISLPAVTAGSLPLGHV